MAKNFKTLYDYTGDEVALEQQFFVKAETTRGSLIAPAGSDFFYTLSGGQIEFTQPQESSPYRTRRHHTSFIKKKKETNWNLSMFWDIDTALGSASVAEINPGLRTLLKQGFGTETLPGGAVALQYAVGIPDFTLSLLENAGRWARQGRGAFVQGINMQFPGDGESTIEFSGNAKDALYVGIGKSVTDNNGGNTVTLIAGDGEEFIDAVGAMVMIVEVNGTTRSADTPDGSPRKIVSVVGDVVTLDGAVLADADGSGGSAEIYLCYYEPQTPVAISNPQTGLEGLVTVDGVSGDLCFRNFGINFQNNHQLKNNCYGTDGLGGSLFVPGSRAMVEVTMELDLNKEIFRLFKRLGSFETQDIDLLHGNSTSRHILALLPKVIFTVPNVAMPDEGSIPVTFTGRAQQTGLDLADEIYLQVK